MKVIRRKSVGGLILSIRILGIALITFILLGFIIFGFTFRRSRIIDRETYVFIGESLYIWSTHSPTNEELIIKIPQDVVITAVDGYGTYSLKALKKLGEIDNAGISLVVRSLEHALGVPIDGSMIIDQTLEDTFAYNLTFVGDTLFSLSGVVANYANVVHSSIPVERYFHHTIRRMIGVAPLFRSVSLETTSVVEERKEADGAVRTFFLPARFDQLYGGLFIDSGIRKERLRIHIRNMTTIAGLGGSVSRVLQNLGSHVVALSSESQLTDTCLIETNESGMKSLTVAFLAKHYGCSVVLSNTNDSQEDIRLSIDDTLADRLVGSK